MEHLRRPRLLDESGNPFNTRVEGVLSYLVPRCQRQFPALRDDLALTEVLEEAGRRIARREARSGPIEKLHGYAWVTIRSSGIEMPITAAVDGVLHHGVGIDAMIEALLNRPWRSE